MNKLFALITNWRLKKHLKLFKEGDYLYVEDHKSHYRNHLVKIHEVLWRDWFKPVELVVSYPWNNAAVSIYIAEIYKFTIYPGSCKPKFTKDQLVIIDHKLYTIDNLVPYIDHNLFNEQIKRFTWKYTCIGTKHKGIVNVLEESLKAPLSSSKVWNNINYGN